MKKSYVIPVLKHDKKDCWNVRLIRAFGLIALIIAVCMLADWFISLHPEEPQKNTAFTFAKSAISTSGTSPENLPQAYVSQKLNSYVQGGKKVPQLFQDEAFFLDTADQCYASSDARTLCFVVRQPADEAYRAVRNELEDKGWQCSESGINQKAVFTKTEGSLHWLFIEVWSTKLGSLIIVSQEGENNGL